MNPIEQPTEVQTPAQRAEIIATFACLASLICLFVVSQPVVEFLHVRWAGGLLCLLFPIGLTFTILYGSSVHREMGRVMRVLFLFGNSLLIFGGICLALLVVAFVAVAQLPLSRFHY
jgi:hypothetical protein